MNLHVRPRVNTCLSIHHLSLFSLLTSFCSGVPTFWTVFFLCLFLYLSTSCFESEVQSLQPFQIRTKPHQARLSAKLLINDIFYSHAYKTHFHMGGLAFSLVLKQLKHDHITYDWGQSNPLRLFSEKWHSLLCFDCLIDHLFVSEELGFFCKEERCRGEKRSTFLTAIISTNSVSSRSCYTPANRNWASISQWRITTSPFLNWLK